MLKFGVTGGIGSGKTLVCNIFEMMYIPVYFADDEAKRLMTEDIRLRKKIIRILGAESYTSDNQLNRQHIAEKVFNDEKLLKKLNLAVHPAVEKDFTLWAEAQTSEYVIKEAALLYESGSYKNLDKIIVVTAPLEMRINRVMKRDGVSRQTILARMKNQMPEEEKAKMADYLIHNDGSKSVIWQTINLHRKLIMQKKQLRYP